MKRQLISSSLVLMVSSLISVNSAQGASLCRQIQDKRDYFRLSVDRDWSTLSETLKYEKYIELVLKNPRCVSSVDYRNAKEYVQDIIENCPPKKGSLMDLYGKKTLKQMCNWAGKTKKKLL
jgi:hypothetical protein